jgi:hypothetical protein
MCNLYSITTNQAAIAGLFRRMNRYVGNLPPMPGVFPDYPAPVIRNVGDAEEMVLIRWGMALSPDGKPLQACSRFSSCPVFRQPAVVNDPWEFWFRLVESSSRRPATLSCSRLDGLAPAAVSRGASGVGDQ